MTKRKKPGTDPRAKPNQASAGNVRHDERGNAIWHWAADSGRHLIDSTSRILKKLEVSGLKLEGEDTGDAPLAPGAAPHRPAVSKKARNPGVNPYESGPPRPSPASQSPHPALSGRPASRPMPKLPEPKRSWWAKLFGK